MRIGCAAVPSRPPRSSCLDCGFAALGHRLSFVHGMVKQFNNMMNRVKKSLRADKIAAGMGNYGKKLLTRSFNRLNSMLVCSGHEGVLTFPGNSYLWAPHRGIRRRAYVSVFSITG